MSRTLAYWSLRGLADPIRFLLAQVGVNYELKVYKRGPPPDYVKDDFRNQMNNLGLDFPNLPYYVDGDIKISQTLAILRHLGRKHGLIVTDEPNITRQDMAEQIVFEVLKFCFQCWLKYTDDSKAELIAYLPSKLEQLNKFLGSNQYVLGDKLTYVDFLLYSTVDYIRIWDATFLNNHQSLTDFLDRIEALPKVNEFIKSGDFNRLPITGPIYGWGGKA